MMKQYRKEFIKHIFSAIGVGCILAVAVFFYRSENVAKAEHPRQFKTAKFSDDVKIFAENRGNFWINLKDGREILTEFDGADALVTNAKSSLSAVSADFDEDGTPDIVIGYKDNAISFMRGNVDAVYPNSADAKKRKLSGEFTDAPFLSPAKIFAAPTMPDFLAAGDFDADGHFDLAVASRTEAAIYFLKGDGKGGFELSKRIKLDGAITAFLSEDFNFRDGLHELIVGIKTDTHAQVLVFEHPYGAIRATPEKFNFSSPVKSLAVGLIEGDERFDLAIATENELAILRGRDRKLHEDESGKLAPNAVLSRLTFDFKIGAMAIGDFIREEKGLKTEVALMADDGSVRLFENVAESENLSAVWRERERILLAENISDDSFLMLTARVSARPIDTLIVAGGERIHLLTSDILPPKSEAEMIKFGTQNFNLEATFNTVGRTKAVLPLRLNVDALSDLVVLRENSALPTIVQTAPNSVFQVTSDANISDGDLNDGICAIPPCPAGLPCTGPCTYLAARQQAHFSGGSNIINFNIPVSEIPLVITPPEFRIFSALTIDGTTQEAGFAEIRGVSPSNSAVHGVFNGNSVFRGLVVNGYVNSGGHFRIESDNNIVEGCRIGTNAEGTAVVPNGNYGVDIRNSNGNGNNLIGGTTPFSRNLISMGDSPGVQMFGTGANIVQGNFIGTDVTGNSVLGNNGSGITVGRPNSLVGGTSFGSGNVISGTTFNGLIYGIGVLLSGGTGAGTIIQGNRIGTNAAGTAALGNFRHGIANDSTPFWDLIGGTTPAARNIISGNNLNGINLPPGCASTANCSGRILGNYIGTNFDGTAAIPNGNYGIHIFGGGGILVENNLISGNTLGGGHFLSSSLQNPIISNNLIGTDASGNNRLGNAGVGLLLSNYNQAAVRDNVIAANTGAGIVSDSSFDNTFERNFIGTNPNLSSDLGNGGDGFRFPGQSRRNIIGGAGAGNTIAYNGGSGINILLVSFQNQFSENRIFANVGDGVSIVEQATENNFNNNSIYGNGDLGIDLNNDGVTANDNCDNDFGGNRLQNYPNIATVTAVGNSVRINGNLNTAVGNGYLLSFYANQAADFSGFGEGEQFIGSMTLNIPGGCQANFTITLPRTLANARCISATATDSIGNTSEFSRCISIKNATADFDSDGIADLSVFRPSNGVWYFLDSSNNGFRTTPFGISTDRIAPADYDGDGVQDIAVFRDGVWYLLQSSLGFRAVQWGTAGDIPLPFDYNGDGRAELAVYRGGVWYVLNLADNQYQIVNFGLPTDLPVPADFDGDGRDDFAVYRNGVWYLLQSSNGFAVVNFGLADDIPTVGDYDGDGRADFAVYRHGIWYLQQSQAGFGAVQFGISNDIPVPADYDGDGRTDIAVYRNGIWYQLRSTGGVGIVQFGLADDRPIPAAFIP